MTLMRLRLWRRSVFHRRRLRRGRNLQREYYIMAIIFGVNTMPEYRRRGLAGELIRCAIDNAGEAGRKGLVLTCKDELVHYYAGFGFKDEGITDKSTHGNVAWHQMRLEF